MTTWQSADGTLKVLVGDVRETLRQIPDGTVQCVVTSPPYWGLRDYGTAQWEGGDGGCDHDQRRREKDPDSKQATNAGSSRDSVAGKQNCRKCGAKRIDRQIGQEPTPDAYVQTMVDVFREVRRVLHDSGTLWLNLGTSYAGAGAGGGGNRKGNEHGQHDAMVGSEIRGVAPAGWKPKDLILIPFLVAEALRQDGWYLRSVIVWAKKSCMPESVSDRPTNSWEPIFLLAKSQRYFYDAEAVKEPAEVGYTSASFLPTSKKDKADTSEGKTAATGASLNNRSNEMVTTRNQRNVWTLGPSPYPEAHFATFVPEIPRRAILAGTSARGCCPKCRAPWVRVVERTQVKRERPNEYTKRTGAEGTGNSCANDVAGVETRTVGWSPGCKCGLEPVPCTVLDPFGGSGTTGQVALELGRDAVLCELNPEYVDLIKRRAGSAAPCERFPLFHKEGEA